MKVLGDTFLLRLSLHVCSYLYCITMYVHLSNSALMSESAEQRCKWGATNAVEKQNVFSGG